MSWLPGQLGGVVKVPGDLPTPARAFSSLVIWARSAEFSAWEMPTFEDKKHARQKRRKGTHNNAVRTKNSVNEHQPQLPRAPCKPGVLDCQLRTGWPNASETQRPNALYHEGRH